jgi:hypothetical protein
MDEPTGPDASDLPRVTCTMDGCALTASEPPHKHNGAPVCARATLPSSPAARVQYAARHSTTARIACTRRATAARSVSTAGPSMVDQ